MFVVSAHVHPNSISHLKLERSSYMSMAVYTHTQDFPKEGKSLRPRRVDQVDQIEQVDQIGGIKQGD